MSRFKQVFKYHLIINRSSFAAKSFNYQSKTVYYENFSFSRFAGTPVADIFLIFLCFGNGQCYPAKT